jgi:hypothetical protein
MAGSAAVKDAKPVRRRFVRIYFDDFEKDHAATFYDPTAFGTWARLLILSEKAWPALPSLPKAIRRADLVTLTADGLFEVQPNGQFLLRGWMKERQARAAKARAAVASRPDRSTDVSTNVGTDVPTNVPTSDVPVRAGVSLSISSSSSEEGVQGEPDAAVAFHQRTGQFPGPRILEWLTELAEAHGETRLASKIGSTAVAGRKIPDYLRAVRDELRAEDYAAEKAKPPKIARPQRPKVDRDAVQAEMRRLYAEGAS